MGGIVDTVLGRLADVFFGFPFILGALIILTVIPERNVLTVSLVLIVFGWPVMTRLMRSTVLGERNKDYVLAARSLGASNMRILRKHILPNALAPVIVYATLTIGGIMVAEATLTFLGVGLQAPAISWGLELASAQTEIQQYPHLLVFPGLFLSLTVLSFVILGDNAQRRARPEVAMNVEVGQAVEGAPPGDEKAALLDVKDLSVEFRLRKKSGPRRQRVLLLGEPGRDAGHPRRVRVGEERDRPRHNGHAQQPAAKVTGGEVWFEGRDLLRLPDRERRRVRGRKIAIIFQDSLSALNPVFTVANQIGEMFRFHDGMNKRAAERAAVDLMARVGIPDAEEARQRLSPRVLRRHAPADHDRHGLGPRAGVLIADEPTTALDVTVQAQIMELLKELQREMGMGLVLITHDLGVVADMADRIVVMYAGKAVEVSPVHELYQFARPSLHRRPAPVDPSSGQRRGRATPDRRRTAGHDHFGGRLPLPTSLPVGAGQSANRNRRLCAKWPMAAKALATSPRL